MRVLVCGGRAYKDQLRVFDELQSLWAGRSTKDPEFVVIAGDAAGADQFAHQWARIVCGHGDTRDVQYAAGWKWKNGKLLNPEAGPIRNQRMLDDGKPDMVLAFPGGRGTADMVRRAKAAGVEVRMVTP